MGFAGFWFGVVMVGVHCQCCGRVFVDGSWQAIGLGIGLCVV